MTSNRFKGMFRILAMLALVAWTLPARSQEVLIEAMRASGELARIVARMRLE